MAIIKIDGNYYFFFNQLIVAALILTMTLTQKDPKGMKSSPSKTVHCQNPLSENFGHNFSSWKCSQHVFLMSPPQFSTLYIISFVVITLGFVMFNAVPTYSALPDSGEDDPAEASGERTAESSSDHLLSADRETTVVSLWLKLTEESTSLLSERFYCYPSTHFLVLGKFSLF